MSELQLLLLVLLDALLALAQPLLQLGHLIGFSLGVRVVHVFQFFFELHVPQLDFVQILLISDDHGLELRLLAWPFLGLQQRLYQLFLFSNFQA